MTLDALIILSGGIIALLPFSGFPVAWDHAILFIIGLCVIALGIAVRRRLSQKMYTQKLPFDDQSNQDR